MSSKSKKNKDRIHQKVAPMPPDTKKALLPYTVVKLVTGAQIIPNFHMKKDLVAVHWNNEAEFVHQEDFDIAKKVSDDIWNELIKAKNLFPSLATIPVGLQIHKLAVERIARIIDAKAAGRKKIMFVKDTSGCGYWRMTVPARYYDTEKFYIDMCESEITYEYLLEYDAIVVQRLHQWREFYTIERLKRMGKRVIYDIDDDIFNIPPHNPASRVIRNDECEAARAIMGIVDKITVTTEILKAKLGFPDKTIVVPNTVDLDDGYPAKWVGSPDEYKRIVWMGSATHHEDWNECFEAVNKVMLMMPKVRLFVMGMLPYQIKKAVEMETNPHWDNRVEYMDFKDVETYVSLCKTVKADIAIAPLQNTSFNSGKSALKWMEYSAAGLPVIASNVSPYKEVITDKHDGLLVNGTDAWYETIKGLIENPTECARLVDNACGTIREKYDAPKTVEKWIQAILG